MYRMSFAIKAAPVLHILRILGVRRLDAALGSVCASC